MKNFDGSTASRKRRSMDCGCEQDHHNVGRITEGDNSGMMDISMILEIIMALHRKRDQQHSDRRGKQIRKVTAIIQGMKHGARILGILKILRKKLMLKLTVTLVGKMTL